MYIYIYIYIINSGQEATIDRMISLLEHHLMTLPDKSSHTGRMMQANDQFYSYQQAYGLLISANGSLKDIPDKFGQVLLVDCGLVLL